jgi:hypothetical protein
MIKLMILIKLMMKLMILIQLMIKLMKEILLQIIEFVHNINNWRRDTLLRIRKTRGPLNDTLVLGTFEVNIVLYCCDCVGVYYRTM